MKIQLITNTSYKNSLARISSYSKVDTLDSYDYNVVDLSCKDVWRQDSSNIGGSNYLNDLVAIFEMIKSSSKAKHIIVLPKNIYYEYSYSNILKSYTKSALLRDNQYLITGILHKLVPANFILGFEPNKTKVGDKLIESDFFYSAIPNGSTKVLKAIDSNKMVSYCVENMVFTSLSIVDGQCVEEFINTLFSPESRSLPEWINSISFNKDEEIKSAIKDKNDSILGIQKEINGLRDRLKENLYFKSILFLNEEDLVERIYRILHLLFGIDLSNFEDKKLEDFNFELDGVTYIGEIKGITSNVKNPHLSELENNKQIFLEKQKDIEDAKGILIINHQRSAEPSKRIPIDKKQINYAKRYDLLIIETTTLLEILDAYFGCSLNIAKLKDLLKNHTGILKDEWK